MKTEIEKNGNGSFSISVQNGDVIDSYVITPKEDSNSTTYISKEEYEKKEGKLTIIDKEDRTGRKWVFDISNTDDTDLEKINSLNNEQDKIKYILDNKIAKVISYEILGTDHAVDIIGIQYDPISKNIRIPIIKRGFEPLGLALPGGFVDNGETREEAAKREFFEELNCKIDDNQNALIKTKLYNGYDENGKLYDFRGDVTTQAFTYILSKNINLKAGDDASGYEYIEIPINLPLEKQKELLDNINFAMSRHRLLLIETLNQLTPEIITQIKEEADKDIKELFLNLNNNFKFFNSYQSDEQQIKNIMSFLKNKDRFISSFKELDKTELELFWEENIKDQYFVTGNKMGIYFQDNILDVLKKIKALIKIREKSNQFKEEIDNLSETIKYTINNIVELSLEAKNPTQTFKEFKKHYLKEFDNKINRKEIEKYLDIIFQEKMKEVNQGPKGIGE